MKQTIDKNLLASLLFLTLCSFFSFINAQVGINTETPRTMLDVNGEVTIRNTSHLTKEPQVLYIDNNGKVGLNPFETRVETTIFYAATNDTILKNLAETFNSPVSRTIEIPLLSDHFVYNTIGIESTGNYLKIQEEGIYHINAFINFNINANLGNNIFLVAKIDISSDNGKTWNAITGSRPVFIQTLTGFQSHPHILPSVISYIASGDLFRLSFYRSFAGGKQGSDVKDMIITSDLMSGTRTYQLVINKL